MISEAIFKQKKYSKGPSIDGRSNAIHDLLVQRHFLKGNNKVIPIVYYDVENFQIKSLTNDVRMGMKNYFGVNQDSDLVNKETEKAHETILIVFDDNISGGATLSDICMQL